MRISFFLTVIMHVYNNEFVGIFGLMIHKMKFRNGLSKKEKSNSSFKKWWMVFKLVMRTDLGRIWMNENS